MLRVISACSLVGVALLLGCAKTNAAYQETSGATSTGVSGETSTNPGTGRGSDATSEGPPADPTSGSTSWGTTGTDDAGQGWTSTGLVVDVGSKLMCTLPLGEPCDTSAQNCKAAGETCAPFSPELGGGIEGTYCLPLGPRVEGERCERRCKGDEEQTCGAGLVCDVFSGLDEVCRPTCDDGNVGCADGVCFHEPTADGIPLAICRGACNPTDIAGCQLGEVCVLTEDGIPYCAAVDSPGQAGDDCTLNLCDSGLVCAPANSGPCTDTQCCAAACNPFSVEVCPKGGVCVALPIPSVAEVGIGYCG